MEKEEEKSGVRRRKSGTRRSTGGTAARCTDSSRKTAARVSRGAVFLPRVPEGRGQGVTCLTAVVARASTTGPARYGVQSTKIGPGPLALLAPEFGSERPPCRPPIASATCDAARRAQHVGAPRERVCVSRRMYARRGPHRASATRAACSRFYFYQFFFFKAFPQPADYSASSASNT